MGLADDDYHFEGRRIDCICDYASSCDGCGELTHHDCMACEDDEEGQPLGYCIKCRPDLHEAIQAEHAKHAEEHGVV